MSQDKVYGHRVNKLSQWSESEFGKPVMVPWQESRLELETGKFKVLKIVAK